jgi:hypothetical protein
LKSLDELKQQYNHYQHGLIKPLHDSLFFDLYLNKKNLNDENHHQQQQQQIKNSYHSISATSSFIQNQNHKALYEYNLTNLASNTEYIIHLSARLDSIESSLAGPLTIRTPSMSFFFFIFFVKG